MQRSISPTHSHSESIEKAEVWHSAAWEVSFVLTFLFSEHQLGVVLPPHCDIFSLLLCAEMLTLRLYLLVTDTSLFMIVALPPQLLLMPHANTEG